MGYWWAQGCYRLQSLAWGLYNMDQLFTPTGNMGTRLYTTRHHDTPVPAFAFEPYRASKVLL